MSAVRSRRILTLDDYFDIELRSEAKHEFVDGEVLVDRFRPVRVDAVEVAARAREAARHLAARSGVV